MNLAIGFSYLFQRRRPDLADLVLVYVVLLFLLPSAGEGRAVWAEVGVGVELPAGALQAGVCLN